MIEETACIFQLQTASLTQKKNGWMDGWKEKIRRLHTAHQQAAALLWGIVIRLDKIGQDGGELSEAASSQAGEESCGYDNDLDKSAVLANRSKAKEMAGKNLRCVC